MNYLTPTKNILRRQKIFESEQPKKLSLSAAVDVCGVRVSTHSRRGPRSV